LKNEEVLGALSGSKFVSVMDKSTCISILFIFLTILMLLSSTMLGKNNAVLIALVTEPSCVLLCWFACVGSRPRQGWRAV
jgi:hypothetical protein